MSTSVSLSDLTLWSQFVNVTTQFAEWRVEMTEGHKVEMKKDNSSFWRKRTIHWGRIVWRAQLDVKHNAIPVMNNNDDGYENELKFAVSLLTV